MIRKYITDLQEKQKKNLSHAAQSKNDGNYKAGAQDQNSTRIRKRELIEKRM